MPNKISRSLFQSDKWKYVKIDLIDFEAIKALYSNKNNKNKIINKRIENPQTDVTACRIYALVSTIRLALGKKPENIDY